MFNGHRIALFLSLLVGFIYISHHFIIPYFLNSSVVEYYPIRPQSYGDESILYAPRAHAAMQGRWFTGDISLAEYPHGPNILPILNPILLGGLGKIFGSMSLAFVVSDFIFPALIFLALYFLAYELTRRELWSLVFASLFSFIPKFGIVIPPVTLLHIKELGKIFFPFLQSTEPFYFSQFEEPKLTFFFFVLACLLFFRAMRLGTRNSAIYAGISFGVLFYTYLYDWTTLFVAILLFAVWSLYKKDFINVKQSAIVVGIGAVISVGYWYNFSELLHYKDVILRAGGEFSHAIRIATVWKSYLRLLVLVFGLVALWQAKDRMPIRVMGALLFSYIMMVNAQIITGFNPQPDHWYRVQFLPIALAVWLILLRLYDLLVSSKERDLHIRGKIIATFFLLYFFSGTAYASVAYSIIHAKDYAISHRTIDSFHWLKENTEEGTVVGTLSGSRNSDILLHTQNKVFLPFGFATLAGDGELWMRVMTLAKLYGLTPKEFKTYVKESIYYLFAEEYGDHSFDANFMHYDRKIPDILLEEKVKEYRAYIKKPNVRYRLDYLYVDAEEGGLGKNPILVTPSLKKEFDNDGIIIYSYPKP